MEAQQYRTVNGLLRYRPVLTEEEANAACIGDNYLGFCLACGNEQDGCEPDARGYTCDTCGERKVFGIPELFVMGLAKVST